jgi:hypothetical protein
MLNDGLKGPSVLCLASPTTRSTLLNISPEREKNCSNKIIATNNVPIYETKLEDYKKKNNFHKHL